MIISMLSINEIPYKVQESTSAAILKGLKSFLPEKLPVTIADATRLEMTGLPVHTIMFFWSLVMEYGTCKFIGGGILMSGFLLRIYLLIIESGLQVLLKKGGDEHEAVNNSLMGCFFSSMHEIWEAVLKLHSMLPKSFFARTRIFRPALCSWAPGTIEGVCPDSIGATVVILNLIFGERGYGWKDVFGSPPDASPGDIAACYSTKPYTYDQKLVALGVIIQMLEVGVGVDFELLSNTSLTFECPNPQLPAHRALRRHHSDRHELARPLSVDDRQLSRRSHATAPTVRG